MERKRATLTAALPLKCFTPEAWAPAALSDVVELLRDHAHLERKAASNTLAMLHRWPETARVQHTPPGMDPMAVPDYWVTTLTDIARDEINHLNLVLEHIIKRGGSFPKFHDSTYAADLRALERRGSYPEDLVDRLLTSSLIEARSCERFFLLAEAAEERDLAKLYSGLWASEHGHYRVFLELAEFVDSKEAVAARMDQLLELEAQVIQAQTPGSRIHSWIS